MTREASTQGTTSWWVYAVTNSIAATVASVATNQNTGRVRGEDM